MNKIQREKQALIHALLKNPTWGQDSAIYQNLEAALGKLSWSNLSNLRLLRTSREASLIKATRKRARAYDK